MKVRDLDNVIDALTPIWVNYGEYFGERFESYEVMRKKTNLCNDDEIKYITVNGAGELVIEV